MSSISSGNAEQYADSSKLAARARLHSKYSVAEVGWFEWVFGQLGLKSGDRVLDIGCGPGWFWESAAGLLPPGIHLTLADQSEGMVQEAENRCRSLPFGSVVGQKADAAALPFEDDSFDVVIAMHMLYHLRDPAAGIAEMHRVLKPGGLLAVTTNGASNLRALYELTTVFGSDPGDPAAAAFGFDDAERLLRERFGDVTRTEHPASLHVTDREDVFLGLTSYPPGDRASAEELNAFRAAIDDAFESGNGTLVAQKQVGLFRSRKADALS